MPISPLVVFVPPAQHQALSEGKQLEITLPASKTWAEVLEDPRGYFDTLIILKARTHGGKWREKLEFPFRGWTKENGQYTIAAKP